MEWNAFVTLASDDLLQALERHFFDVRLRGGEMLFDQGEHDDRLFVLESGALEVSVVSEAGKRLSLNRIRPGNLFGEIAVFDPGERTARVDATEDSLLKAVRHGDLDREMGRSPTLCSELLRLAGRRMRWMSAQVEDQVFLPPASRLASKVLYLAGSDTEIEMSQARLADYVGVTREAVSKTLSEWQREGIVTLSRNRIAVRDADALDAIKTCFL